MKKFKTQVNIGKAKYVISYHNGVSAHKDGSDFYDIAILNNKKDLKDFTNSLLKDGYSETN